MSKIQLFSEAMLLCVATIGTMSPAISQAATIPNKNGQTSISDFASGLIVNGKNASLYDANGKKLNRTLGANTSWKTDVQNVVNGKIYYRVATNEYVEGEQVIIYKTSRGNIKITSSTPAALYNRSGKKLSRALAPNTIWYTDSFIMINHTPFVRVSTNEYVQTGDFVAVN